MWFGRVCLASDQTWNDSYANMFDCSDAVKTQRTMVCCHRLTSSNEALKIVSSKYEKKKWNEKKSAPFLYTLRLLPVRSANTPLACPTCRYSMDSTWSIAAILIFHASPFRLHCTKLRFWDSSLALSALYSGSGFKSTQTLLAAASWRQWVHRYSTNCYVLRICL